MFNIRDTLEFTNSLILFISDDHTRILLFNCSKSVTLDNWIFLRVTRNSSVKFHMSKFKYPVFWKYISLIGKFRESTESPRDIIEMMKLEKDNMYG